MYGNYDRGGMQVEVEEKHHKGGAIFMLIFSIGWIWAYSVWMNYVSTDCCVWWQGDSIYTWGVCGGIPPAHYDTKINVSADFRMICVVGVSLYVVLAVVSLGHCCKPFRCFSKIFGSLIWFALFVFFIASNVYRFRDSGRICSNEDQQFYLSTDGADYLQWY